MDFLSGSTVDCYFINSNWIHFKIQKDFGERVIMRQLVFFSNWYKKVAEISAVVTKLNVNIAGSPSLSCSINPLLLNVVFPYTMAPLGSFQTPK